MIQTGFYIIVTFFALINIGDTSNNLKYSSFPKNNFCVFNNPDTSVSGIVLRDANSTIRILGKHISLQGDSTHNFYSMAKDQILSLTDHAGDYRSQVSIFKISYNNSQKIKCQQTQIDFFKTEKGICLGISKEEIVDKLGKCYTTKIIKDAEIIKYRLESPQDNNTKLLARHNMPIYYANYKFHKKKLVIIEFGFEYP